MSPSLRSDPSRRGYPSYGPAPPRRSWVILVRRFSPRGLWNLPELWTATLEAQLRRAAHKLLGRRQTDASAHSFHKASPSRRPNQGKEAARKTPCRRG